MLQRNVTEAKAELSSLLVRVEAGEEVVIARAGKPIAKIVRIEQRGKPRKPGALKGQIWVSDDFDAPDPEIEALFYEGPIEPTP